jgi:hypothetical protein
MMRTWERDGHIVCRQPEPQSLVRPHAETERGPGEHKSVEGVHNPAHLRNRLFDRYGFFLEKVGVG